MRVLLMLKLWSVPMQMTQVTRFVVFTDHHAEASQREIVSTVFRQPEEYALTHKRSPQASVWDQLARRTAHGIQARLALVPQEFRLP